MKTRGKKPAASRAAPAAPSAAGREHVLPPCESNPPQLFILPDDASPESRFLTLPHPATSRPTRYFLDPARGFYEFTRVSAPKKSCRSVLLVPEGGQTEDGEGAVQENGGEEEVGQREKGGDDRGDDEEGYILQSPDLFVTTPVDTVFILLPALWPTGNLDHREEWSIFDDRLFSNNGEDVRYQHLRSVFHSASGAGKALEMRMEARMRDVCDTIEMGDETSYKLNLKKLAGVVYEKAERMAAAGLPASMEEHFIKRALEAPEQSVKNEESSGLRTADESPDPEPTVVVGPNGTRFKISHLAHLLRLRTALRYLSSTLLPTSLTRCLQRHFDSGFINFMPLTVYLAEVAELKAEAHALRSISDNISRKRGILDDEEALGRAEVKKRKKEEEEVKRKGMSAGVKRLGKVDVGGMKKMSDFFGKKS